LQKHLDSFAGGVNCVDLFVCLAIADTKYNVEEWRVHVVNNKVNITLKNGVYM